MSLDFYCNIILAIDSLKLTNCRIYYKFGCEEGVPSLYFILDFEYFSIQPKIIALYILLSTEKLYNNEYINY